MKTQSKHKQSGIMTGKRDCAMNDFGLSFDSDWLSRGWFPFLSKGDAKFSRAVKEIEGAKIRAAIRPRKLLYNLLLCDPFLNVLLHGFLVREFELPCDAVNGPLGLRVEHGVSVVLVLHSNVEKLVVASLGPQHILVHPGGVQDIPGLQSEALFKERKVEVVAGAQNDGVHIGSGTILEVDSFAHDLCYKWSLSDLRGPLEAHRPGLVGANDLLGAIFEVLQSDILSGIAGADHKKRLSLELIGISEVV